MESVVRHRPEVKYQGKHAPFKEEDDQILKGQSTKMLECSRVDMRDKHR